MTTCADIWPRYISDSVGRGWAFTLPDGTTETLYFVRHKFERFPERQIRAAETHEVELAVQGSPVPAGGLSVGSTDDFTDVSPVEDSSHFIAEAHRGTFSRLASYVKRRLRP